MSDLTCQLLVVGGGPGGYTAAIRGAQHGLDTILVEHDQMGGTCLNRGCLPTKTLLEDSLLVAAVRGSNFLRGDMKINRQRILERKDAVVHGSRSGITAVLQGNGVRLVAGAAAFLDGHSMRVQPPGDLPPFKITADNIVLATGAAVPSEPGLQPDGHKVLSTDEALRLDPMPRTLAVAGAGNRGVEFAAIYHNLGVKVVLIEQEKRILPREHRWISKRYKKILTDRRMKVLTKTRLVQATAEDEGVTLTLEGEEGSRQARVDQVLLALPRQPAYAALALDKAGLDPQGTTLAYGPDMCTGSPGIYVVGDAAGAPYLAHKAIAQAMAAVDHILGTPPAANPPCIPNCIYGDPEVASVGLTDYQAKKQGIATRTGEFYLAANGRAATLGRSEGLILMVAEKESGKILGVHIMGPAATETIALGVTAIQNGLRLQEIERTVLPHMTISESFFEAALAASGKPIHLLADKTAAAE